MIRFIIQGEPASKKNSQDILQVPRKNRQPGQSATRPMIVQSRNYRQYETDCGWQIPQKARLHIDYPVNVKAIYYRSTYARIDRTNLESALMDVLVKYGVIDDDNRDVVAATDGSRVYYDKDHPRTVVEITPLDDPEYDLFWTHTETGRRFIREQSKQGGEHRILPHTPGAYAAARALAKGTPEGPGTLHHLRKGKSGKG